MMDDKAQDWVTEQLIALRVQHQQAIQQITNILQVVNAAPPVEEKQRPRAFGKMRGTDDTHGASPPPGQARTRGPEAVGGAEEGGAGEAGQ